VFARSLNAAFNKAFLMFTSGAIAEFNTEVIAFADSDVAAPTTTKLPNGLSWTIKYGTELMLSVALFAEAAEATTSVVSDD
jgi:hypothetical protein